MISDAPYIVFVFILVSCVLIQIVLSIAAAGTHPKLVWSSFSGREVSDRQWRAFKKHFLHPAYLANVVTLLSFAAGMAMLPNKELYIPLFMEAIAALLVSIVASTIIHSRSNGPIRTSVLGLCQTLLWMSSLILLKEVVDFSPSAGAGYSFHRVAHAQATMHLAVSALIQMLIVLLTDRAWPLKTVGERNILRRMYRAALSFKLECELSLTAMLNTFPARQGGGPAASLRIMRPTYGKMLFTGLVAVVLVLLPLPPGVHPRGKTWFFFFQPVNVLFPVLAFFLSYACVELISRKPIRELRVLAFNARAMKLRLKRTIGLLYARGFWITVGWHFALISGLLTFLSLLLIGGIGLGQDEFGFMAVLVIASIVVIACSLESVPGVIGWVMALLLGVNVLYQLGIPERLTDRINAKVQNGIVSSSEQMTRLRWATEPNPELPLAGLFGIGLSKRTAPRLLATKAPALNSDYAPLVLRYYFGAIGVWLVILLHMGLLLTFGLVLIRPLGETWRTTAEATGMIESGCVSSRAVRKKKIFVASLGFAVLCSSLFNLAGNAATLVPFSGVPVLFVSYAPQFSLFCGVTFIVALLRISVMDRRTTDSVTLS